MFDPEPGRFVQHFGSAFARRTAACGAGPVRLTFIRVDVTGATKAAEIVQRAVCASHRDAGGK